MWKKWRWNECYNSEKEDLLIPYGSCTLWIKKIKFFVWKSTSKIKIDHYANDKKINIQEKLNTHFKLFKNSLLHIQDITLYETECSIHRFLIAWSGTDRSIRDKGINCRYHYFIERTQHWCLRTECGTVVIEWLLNILIDCFWECFDRWSFSIQYQKSVDGP